MTNIWPFDQGIHWCCFLHICSAWPPLSFLGLFLVFIVLENVPTLFFQIFFTLLPFLAFKLHSFKPHDIVSQLNDASFIIFYLLFCVVSIAVNSPLSNLLVIPPKIFYFSYYMFLSLEIQFGFLYLLFLFLICGFFPLSAWKHEVYF